MGNIRDLIKKIEARVDQMNVRADAFVGKYWIQLALIWALVIFSACATATVLLNKSSTASEATEMGVPTPQQDSPIRHSVTAKLNQAPTVPAYAGAATVKHQTRQVELNLPAGEAYTICLEASGAGTLSVTLWFDPENIQRSEWQELPHHSPRARMPMSRHETGVTGTHIYTSGHVQDISSISCITLINPATSGQQPISWQAEFLKSRMHWGGPL